MKERLKEQEKKVVDEIIDRIHNLNKNLNRALEMIMAGESPDGLKLVRNQGVEIDNAFSKLHWIRRLIEEME